MQGGDVLDSDEGLARSALGCHRRIVRLDETQKLRTAVMMALVERDGRLDLAINSAWQADPLGLIDSHALLRRRYAASVRDPMRSAWRDRLRGLYRASAHRLEQDPCTEPPGDDEPRCVTSELILLDGRYLRLTTTEGLSGLCAEAGTWRSEPVRSRIPHEIIDGLEHRRAYDLPVRRFAAAIGVDGVDVEYADIELVSKACVERAAVREATLAERERGDVAGLDIAIYALLDHLVWSAADLSDLLTGRWSPWRG